MARLAPDLPILLTKNGIGLWDYLGPDGSCRDLERVRFLDAYLPALPWRSTKAPKSRPITTGP